jgi:hypothetical protein
MEGWGWLIIVAQMDLETKSVVLDKASFEDPLRGALGFVQKAVLRSIF